jgi:hypothetical protein
MPMLKFGNPIPILTCAEEAAGYNNIPSTMNT